jgi:hypothetical protein
MTVSASSFKTRFRAFASEEDAYVDLFIEEAARVMDRSRFSDEDRADDAQGYLVAHLLTLEKRAEVMAKSGSAGPVSSETVGPLSRSFASNWGSATGYDTTPYGQEFKKRIAATFPTPLLGF